MIASMLQSAGMDIGSRLMGPHEGNPRGHFEDLDFYEFHVAVLTALGLGSEGYVLQPTLAVDEPLRRTAHGLIQSRRQAGRLWGWKDPRTTLFLDFWREQLPEARFLLLFRAPWEVADSMFRRGDTVFQQNPALTVKVWLNYNRALLDFHGRFPERCLLIESHAAALAPHRLIEKIATQFGDHFGPAGNLFEKDLFRQDSSCHGRDVLQHVFPEAVEMYERLRAQATLVLPERQAAAESADYADDWALKHWVAFRVAEKSGKRAAAELQEARAEVRRLQDYIISLSSDKKALQGKIASMQDSKFWKLRELCMRVRHSLNMRQPL